MASSEGYSRVASPGRSFVSGLSGRPPRSRRMTGITGTLGAALPTAFVLAVLGSAALSDLRRYLIPNRYPALLILGFLLRTAFVAATGQEVGITVPLVLAAALFAGGYA